MKTVAKCLTTLALLACLTTSAFAQMSGMKMDSKMPMGAHDKMMKHPMMKHHTMMGGTMMKKHHMKHQMPMGHDNMNGMKM
jgi:hypothetical protein